MTEYEKIGWWEFIGAHERSPAYQKLLGHGITRSLVAAKADAASTKTIGNIFVQLLFDIVAPGPSTDRVLNGPTNDVWINPWLEYLRARGLRYHCDSKVTAVTFEGGRICDATVVRDGAARKVPGDYFIFAMPVEDVIDLITPQMIAAEPALGHLFTLDDITEWMNGIQIYLTEDVRIAHGHTIYVDSPWALTSISQAQFWKNVDLSSLGDGAVKGLISVDISEWEEKGLNGKPANACTSDEIKAEVWEQLKRSLNYGDNVLLKDEHLHRWNLDPDIRIPVGFEGTTANEEPLLVNLVDTWKLRPEAVTRIPNLFLASDYVRTNTDLATMEAANEAARRAVNGILAASRSDAVPCTVWDLHEPEIFAPCRELDAIRYAQGLPWDDALVKVGLSIAALVDNAIVTLEGDSEPPAGAASRGAATVQDQIVSLVSRATHGNATLDLRQQATALLERLGRVVALRLAEAQAAGRRSAPTAAGLQGAGPTDPLRQAATGRTRPGRVQILPR
jgi:uncharacterized protein with NAD-binding domain and iron-sulfur cluster